MMEVQQEILAALKVLILLQLSQKEGQIPEVLVQRMEQLLSEQR